MLYQSYNNESRLKRITLPLPYDSLTYRTSANTIKVVFKGAAMNFDHTEQSSHYDCIIAGAGASGLMLAASLDLHGRRGLILEKGRHPGAKLLLSGGGRCNITHGGPVRDFLYAYGDAGPALRKCLYRHSNAELAEWLEDHGIALADETGSPVSSGMLYDSGSADVRIFPASMKAGDVLAVLTEQARAHGWEMRTATEIYDLLPGPDRSAGQLWTVKASPAETFTAGSVVIATGGITFPETGSDGSMFSILRDLGIGITELKPALAPVYVKDYPYEEMSGISLSGVTVTAFSSDAAYTCKGKAARMTGDLLFTHRGFSGPVILNISKYTEPGELLRISYNRELSELPKRLQRALEKRAAGPSGDVRTTVLALLLERDDFTVDHTDENGMVTSGGISLDCIDTSTMQITGQPGLYAIGEAIDADGITGGYNLQMCWSTARTAAEDIGQED